MLKIKPAYFSEIVLRGVGESELVGHARGDQRKCLRAAVLKGAQGQPTGSGRLFSQDLQLSLLRQRQVPPIVLHVKQAARVLLRVRA
jgi:hypothetical protein